MNANGAAPLAAVPKQLHRPIIIAERLGLAPADVSADGEPTGTARGSLLHDSGTSGVPAACRPAPAPVGHPRSWPSPPGGRRRDQVLHSAEDLVEAGRGSSMRGSTERAADPAGRRPGAPVKTSEPYSTIRRNGRFHGRTVSERPFHQMRWGR